MVPLIMESDLEVLATTRRVSEMFVWQVMCGESGDQDTQATNCESKDSAEIH
jgi:hypothetical protein